MADPNSSFREHDVEYLQKRTKIWFEAVLGEKFGDRTLADMIADGSIMYRVSKHISREMTGASPGLQDLSPGTFSEMSAAGKKSGKYLPYANVDTFLKICRKVGMTDVELFSPPDVVEGKDIRRVCTSIRCLARKARAQQISVPDFEDVNRPLPMPKEKVGELRGSLQHSNTSPVSRASASPDSDIQKSERVQIISRFLSATRPSAENDNAFTSPSPSTPQLKTTQSLSANDTSSWRSPSTPSPTIGGAGSPALTKSASLNESSSALLTTSSGNLESTPESAEEEELDDDKESARQPTSSQSIDQASQSPFSEKKWTSFKHAQPHFVKTPSQKYYRPDPPKSPSEKNGDSRPEPGVAPHDPPPKARPSSTPPSSEDTKKSSSSKQPYRHAQPHFSFSKSSESESAGAPTSHSQELQPKNSDAGADANKIPPPAKHKSSSSNKIVEKDQRSLPHTPDRVSRTSSKQSSKHSHEQPGKKMNSRDRPKVKENNFQINFKLWVPIVAGALAFMGTLLLVRKRDPKEYEVQRGDTLSKISKQVGKKNWDELVKMNPSITNPNLIYPSDRLKLPSERGRHHH